MIDFSRALEIQKPGCDPQLSIRVRATSNRMDNEITTKAELSCRYWDGNEFHTIAGADFDTIIAEVNRRLGFTDQQTIALDKLQTALKALPAPEPTFDELFEYLAS
jgi:hypothetical protein